MYCTCNLFSPFLKDLLQSNLLCVAVSVADYISRAESESRQGNPRDLKNNIKDMVTTLTFIDMKSNLILIMFCCLQIHFYWSYGALFLLVVLYCVIIR